MLSRVADSLYWMSRYIERAGNIARLVEVNMEVLLDLSLEQQGSRESYWYPLLDATALTEKYQALEDESKRPEVPEFLTLSLENPDSIRSCIAQARENARMVRDQISDEMWLELNSLHLFLSSPAAAALWHRDPEDFCTQIIRFSLLFQGITDATIPHDEGWQFIRTGRFLERADKTTRILDIPHRLQSGRGPLPWATVLSSCSARAAYRQLYGGEVTERLATNLLIFSDVFPRSVRFCLRMVDEALHAISGTPRGQYSIEAERLTGSALASLDFAGPDEVEMMGLPAYADQLQTKFNDIGQQVFATYVLLPSEVALQITEQQRLVYAYTSQSQQQ